MSRFLISIFFCFFTSSVFASFTLYGGSSWSCNDSSCSNLAVRVDECLLSIQADPLLLTCVMGAPYFQGSSYKAQIYKVSIDHCPSGTAPSGVSTSSTVPRCDCSAGYSSFTSSGVESCACDDGYVADYDGTLTNCDRPTPDCGANGFSTLADGSKICNPDCPTGQESDGQGGCQPITCPAGYELVGNDCLPECTGGRTRSGTSCVCASSTSWNGTTCVADISGCPAGQVFNGSSCVAANSTPAAGSTGGVGTGTGGSGGVGGTGSVGGSGGYTGAGGFLGTSTGAASSDCSVRPACSDDSIECAQLVQQWVAMCEDNNFSEADLDADKLGEDGEEGVFTSISEVIPDLAGRFDAVFNQSAAGGTCPPPQSISTHFGTYEVSYQPFCDLAIALAPMLVLIFTLMAARIVYTTLD